MNGAAISMRYEQAARFRDIISKIKETLTRQKVVVHGGGDHDVVALLREGRHVAICIFMVRGGILMDRRLHAMSITGEEDTAIMESFLMEHYCEGSEIPPHIYISVKPEGLEAIKTIISERAKKNIRIAVPKRGMISEMMKLAGKNAQEMIKSRISQGNQAQKILTRLQKKLRLPRIPEVIECLDISNLMGREAYGSLVTFVNGKPDKSRYRLYYIRTLKTPNDYGMMREVLTRRFGAPLPTPFPPAYAEASAGKRGGRVREGVTLSNPDLLLIDGGKGQLNIALQVIEELNLSNFSVAAIAKAPEEGPDRIFLPGRKDPVAFKHQSPEFLLLCRIRDEAHRFGINAHRKRHVREAFSK